MRKIAIIGAGGFAREVKSLIDDINKVKLTYDIMGYYDDNIKPKKVINELEVLGKIDSLNSIDFELDVALGVGKPNIKRNIIDKLKNTNIKFPNLIHPNVIRSHDVNYGCGSIICAGNILTCNIEIQNFITLNLACTIGHDTVIKDFSSFMPCVNIAGEVVVEHSVYVGMGAKIINQIVIGERTIVGAGAVVLTSLPSDCTVFGNPAKRLNFIK